MLPGTEQDGPDGQVQFVDQRRLQVLPDRGYTAAQANVTAAGRGGRLDFGRSPLPVSRGVGRHAFPAARSPSSRWQWHTDRPK